MLAGTARSLLYLQLIFAVVTLLIIIALVASIASKRFKLYKNSFFSIFSIACFFNAFALVNLNVGGIMASLGLMPTFYTETNVTVKIFFFFAYFARCGEVLSTVLIALNRMTAIFLPFRHAEIWSLRTQIFCFSYQFLFGLILGVSVVVTSDFSWKHIADGSSIPELHQSPAVSILLLGILGISSAFIGFIFILYVISYYRLKKNLANDLSDNRTERSLTYIAVCTCGIEVAYYLVFAYVFVIAKNFENHPLTFHVILSLQGNINSGIHPYLVLLFSSVVREALRKTWRCRRLRYAGRGRTVQGINSTTSAA